MSMTRRMKLAVFAAVAFHALALAVIGFLLVQDRDDARGPSPFAAEFLAPAPPPKPMVRGPVPRRREASAHMSPTIPVPQAAPSPVNGVVRNPPAASVTPAIIATTPPAAAMPVAPSPAARSMPQARAGGGQGASPTRYARVGSEPPKSLPLPAGSPGGRSIAGAPLPAGQPGSAVTRNQYRDYVPRDSAASITVGSAGAIPASRQTIATRVRGLTHRGASTSAPGVAADTFRGRNHAGDSASYDAFADNRFRSPTDEPLSTFAIDVDTASYSNVRRFITQGRLPPADSVRVEEMVNYFRYDYPQPDGDAPLAVYTEVGDAPWRPEHRLVHIGLQGRRVEHGDRPASNLVFLLDVSGSMSPANKLPLLKQAFRLLVGELDARDRVAIVTYAGRAGLALEPTSGAEKRVILAAIASLGAGGSTAGADGIRTAYELARRSFIPGGINRVILATDGDFNVGVSDDGPLVRMIEEKREGGVFLTVLGFGEGNLKDAKMHKLADKGNGSYHYIDTLFEAKKVLIDEMGATLQTIAKDVKIQVEFNPAHVAAYRLVGYESRLLAAADFADDKKDAGELGAGHTVTALYEVIPRGVDSPELARLGVPLKYQRHELRRDGADELLTVKLRYKQPDADTSVLLTRVVGLGDLSAECSDCFRFSAAVALFGMLLRDSVDVGEATVDDALELARGSLGDDSHGYRRQFVDMVGLYGRLLETSLN
jgi:Ca-activated chloride channel family protein